MDYNKLWKILEEMGVADHINCLLRNLYQVKKQQLELDTEQQTGSKLGKEYIKAVYCHLAYCIMRNAELDETQARIKIAERNINNLRYANDNTLTAK